MKRAYSFSQWHADFARAFAASVPMEAMETKARGPLLAAENDEPSFADLQDIKPRISDKLRDEFASGLDFTDDDDSGEAA